MTDYRRLAADAADDAFFARINQPCWHMCIAETPEVVFLETILGPHRGTTFANWAPGPDSPAAMDFFRQICGRCGVSTEPAE